MATNTETYLPPSVEPGCSGRTLDLTPCPTVGEMSLETVFDIIQTPIIGIILGLVIFFQFRKMESVKRPGLWAVGAGILGSALYGAMKFVF